LRKKRKRGKTAINLTRNARKKKKFGGEKKKKGKDKTCQTGKKVQREFKYLFGTEAGAGVKEGGNLPKRAMEFYFLEKRRSRRQAATQRHRITKSAACFKRKQN